MSYDARQAAQIYANLTQQALLDFSSRFRSAMDRIAKQIEGVLAREDRVDARAIAEELEKESTEPKELNQEWAAAINDAKNASLEEAKAAAQRLEEIRKEIGSVKAALASLEKAIQGNAFVDKNSEIEDAKIIVSSIEAQQLGSSEEKNVDLPSQPDKIYIGERFNIEFKGNLRTITDKQGNIILQFEKNGPIIQNNMTEGHKRIFRQVRQNIDAAKLRDGSLKRTLRDSTGVKQTNTLGPFAPQGSTAIAVAHNVIPDDKNKAVGNKFTFIRHKDNAYSVYRNDAASEKDSVVAFSRADGAIVSGNQQSEELNLFEKSYADARNRISAASKPQGATPKMEGPDRDR